MRCRARRIRAHSERLRRLEASSLFLVPLDRRREWYRYHGLFREFLLGELRRVEPDVIAKLHLRAADWYESNGSPAMAVEHLLHTTERDRCVQLVTALVLPTYQAGQMSTVQRWLAALGDAAIEQYPPLAVLAGWMAVFTGQTVEAQRWAAIVDAASFDLVPVDGTASFDSARAMLRAVMCAAGPEQMLADASFAVDQEPPWSPWRDTALCLLAEAHLLTGDVDQAAALFAEASALAADDVQHRHARRQRGPSSPCWRWIAGAGRRRPTRLELALAAIDEHRMHDYATSVLAFAGAARLAVHRGDLKEANRQLTRAMRARPSCTFALPYLAVRVRLQLAKVYWAIADHDDGSSPAARDRRHPAPPAGARRPRRRGLGVPPASSHRARRLGAAGASPLTPAELRLLPYLQTHLTIREIAERLFVSRNTVNSQVSARSIESWASPRATKRCNRRRRSVCSAGSRAHPPDWGSKASSVS